MKRFIHYNRVFALFLLKVTVLFSQGVVRRGTACPDFRFDRLVNTKADVYSLKDLKGKVIIIDFWHIHCTSCIEKFPSLDSLQKQFDGQLQILPIAMEVDELVPALFQKLIKRHLIRSNGLTSVMDTSFFQKFNGHYTFYGQFVWIDQAGIVQYYTLKDKVTAENIEAFIKGSQVTDLEKTSEEGERIANYDPLSSLNSGSDDLNSSNILFHSSLKDWKKEMGFDLNAFINSKDPGFIKTHLYRLSGINLSQLYNLAYCDTITPFPFLHPNVYGEYWYEPVVENRSTAGDKEVHEKLMKPYCFTLRLPPGNITAFNMQQSLRQALLYSFGDSVTVENRLMPYWRLIATVDAEKKIKSKEGPSIGKSKEGMGILLRNKSVEDLVIELWNYLQYQGPGFKDETGIKFPIDLDLNFDEFNLEEWKAALATIGLNLVAGQRIMKVIVIHPREPAGIVGK